MGFFNTGFSETGKPDALDSPVPLFPAPDSQTVLKPIFRRKLKREVNNKIVNINPINRGWIGGNTLTAPLCRKKHGRNKERST